MDQKKIGDFIAALRKEAGMTQQELGKIIGVTNKTISRWENGNYLPDIVLMKELSNFFQISINELLSGERISDEDYRKKADENIIVSIDQMKKIRKGKSISDFFCGAGTGILTSTLYAPDNTRKLVVGLIGLIMIGIGWYFRSSYHKIIIS
ncbi:transcriptional repressor DicA [uncultured Eubacterium sp.]|uniref:helix-turn-helix transcriptional regulator n=1 Tax=Emergencia sp. TaxID=1926557 RepID=UPI000820933A|nr:transcriptional repressor DicA [uncultured Eubacterium sp.]